MTSHEKPTPGLMGVYLIENTVTGRRYVGSSVSVHSRLQNHMMSLNKG